MLLLNSVWFLWHLICMMTCDMCIYKSEPKHFNQLIVVKVFSMFANQIKIYGKRHWNHAYVCMFKSKYVRTKLKTARKSTCTKKNWRKKTTLEMSSYVFHFVLFWCTIKLCTLIFTRIRQNRKRKEIKTTKKVQTGLINFMTIVLTLETRKTAIGKFLLRNFFQLPFKCASLIASNDRHSYIVFVLI